MTAHRREGDGQPHMLPLRVRVAGGGDAFVVLRPGDPGYYAAYARTAAAFRRFGRPMPYATPDEIAGAAPVPREPDADPPRRPLRLRVATHRRAPDGHMVFTDGYAVVRPGDDAYEQEYHAAVFAYQRFGTPMPYADGHAGEAPT